MSHELEIGPVIAGDILDAIGELLTFRKQLPQVTNTARHGIAAHVDDFGVRQHEMNEPDVAEVVRHFVDEEWLSLTVSARVHDVAFSEPAEFFGRKFGQNSRVTIIFKPPYFNHDALDVGEFVRPFDQRVRGEDLLDER